VVRSKKHFSQPIVGWKATELMTGISANHKIKGDTAGRGCHLTINRGSFMDPRCRQATSEQGGATRKKTKKDNHHPVKI
jgi:hypothetical protein